MIKPEGGKNEIPHSGWYYWKDDQTGTYHTYYQDEDNSNSTKTSYKNWANENIY